MLGKRLGKDKGENKMDTNMKREKLENLESVKKAYNKKKHLCIKAERVGGEYYIDTDPKWYKDYHYILLSWKFIEKVRPRKSLKFLDKYGYPVEIYEGKPIINFLRRILWTRKIKYSF